MSETFIQEAENVLKKYFGLKEFKPSQVEIISLILNGENVLAVMPTGSGKSLCYQIPAILGKNFSIVISPLIALMKDQVDSLNKNHQIAAFINSTLEWFEIEKVLNKVSANLIKLLYIAPERLESKEFVERIVSLQSDYLFIDEAHCISEWGHNFRPSYTKLKNFIEHIDIKKVSAFTATATPEVINDIIDQLQLNNVKIIVKGFERDNISLNVFQTNNKKEKLLEILNVNPAPVLIYTSIRRKAELINQFLNLNKFKSEFYHAGLNPIIRKKIQDEFIDNNIPIVVATNAFGMGIDKKNIRTVIHYDIPASIESYYQEFGRAGRDGKSANAFLLFKEKDLNVHKYFINNSYPTKEIIQSVYNGICDSVQLAVGNIYTDEIPINYDYLKNYSNKKLNSALIHSSLKYLEKYEYLKINSILSTSDSVKFIQNPDFVKRFIKASFNNELKILILYLVKLFGSNIFNYKVNIDYKSIELDTGLSQDLQKSLLIFLKDLGIIEYNQFEGKETINLLKPRTSTDYLKLDYAEINKYYLIANDKLDKMRNFVTTNECRFKYILNYFSQNTESYTCGKCDNCNKTIFLTKSFYEITNEEKKINVNNEDDVFNHLELYNRLNKIRLKAAEKFNQTPNMICPDYVLAKISKVKPETKLQLLSISGVNLRIFNKIGEEFLQEIQAYLKSKSINEKNIPNNIVDTYKLLRRGFNLSEISQLRKMDEAIVSMQIETIISLEPDINLQKIISNDLLNEIRKIYSYGKNDLREIKKELSKKINSEISISLIRIALAKIKKEQFN
jgi:ATP-dependent DNA helicase RecQ